jgi:hypothetical protein
MDTPTVDMVCPR